MQIYFVYLSLICNFETLSRTYFRSEMKIKQAFLLHFSHLFVTLWQTNKQNNLKYLL